MVQIYVTEAPRNIFACKSLSSKVPVKSTIKTLDQRSRWSFFVRTANSVKLYHERDSIVFIVDFEQAYAHWLTAVKVYQVNYVLRNQYYHLFYTLF